MRFIGGVTGGIVAVLLSSVIHGQPEWFYFLLGLAGWFSGYIVGAAAES